jgi:heme exporter protein D
LKRPVKQNERQLMRNLDFSSWQTLLLSFVGIAVVTVIGVAIRLLIMQSVQQRRDRENRQINERLRTLIAAYKALGGSFTGSLEVDPRHKRDLKGADEKEGGERARRIRDTVEAALSDIILLGTEEQVRLAAHAASQLVSGRTVETVELVVSLRNFIREALDLAPIPTGLSIPRQGPTRITVAKGGKEGNGKDDGKGGGGSMGAAGTDGIGGGMIGVQPATTSQEEDHEEDGGNR